MRLSGPSLFFRRTLLPTLFTTALLATHPASAQGQAFSVEDIMSAGFPSGLTAAHQGSRVAWVYDERGASNVWTADGPTFTPRQVTHYTGDDGVPTASLRLTPDGSEALYARGTELNHEGLAANPTSLPYQPKQQVFRVSTTGKGEPRLLGEMGCEFEGCEDIEISPDGRWAVWEGHTQLWIVDLANPQATAKKLTEIRGVVGEPRWSPDSKRIAISVNRVDHALIAILDVTEGKLDKINWISPSTNRDSAPRWSPDGRQLAFLRSDGREHGLPLIPVLSEPWSLLVADTATYTAKPAFISGAALRDSLPLFSKEQFFFPANDRIVFSSEADGRNHLYSVAPTGGEPVKLTPGEFDVEEVSLSADKKSLLYTSNQYDANHKEDEDRRHLWKVAVAGGTPQTALTAGETIEWTPVETADGKSLLCFGSTATSPALVYSVTAGKRTLITPNALAKNFPSAALLVTPRQVTFPSEGGLTIHGQLFQPKGRTRPGPALIFTHGGPKRQMLLGFHYRGYYHNSYAENQYLVSLGYTVLSVNYRLGIMYGRDFREAKDGGWRGSSEYNDVVAGAKYLQSLPSVNPHQIGLWGGSYGGLLTALGLARNSDIFKTGVDFHGVHDWSAIMGNRGFSPSAPDYAQAMKMAADSTASASVDTWKSPVLFIHGDDDRNVAFNQTVTLAEQLKKRHVEFEEIIYPDEIHDLLLWGDWVRSYKATADWFQKYLPLN